MTPEILLGFGVLAIAVGMLIITLQLDREEKKAKDFQKKMEDKFRNYFEDQED